jgi:hypothetical protein
MKIYREKNNPEHFFSAQATLQKGKVLSIHVGPRTMFVGHELHMYHFESKIKDTTYQ